MDTDQTGSDRQAVAERAAPAGHAGMAPPTAGGHAAALTAEGTAADWSLRTSVRPRTGTVVSLLAVGAIGLAGLFALGLRPLLQREHALAAGAEHVHSAPLRVTVISAQPGAARNDLVLPGECVADQASDLFARTNGYIKSWAVDIGDHVSAGQLLCSIETPEIDEELSQADAALAQARARVGTALANGRLTAISLKRASELRTAQTISEQTYNERVAADEVAHAEVEAAQAEVLVAEANQRRLGKLHAFESVTAPFAGIITARNAEVGSLVSAGSAAGAKPLFRLAHTEVLRLFIDVPQNVAHEVQVGQTVRVLVRERPGQRFEGAISRTAGVIDPTSRTLRVEVRVDNAAALLWAGMYVQVQVSVPASAPPLLVPGSTLVFNSDGNQLALVKDGRVHFQPVTVAGDYGKAVGISAGLLPGDQIIANPGAQLSEGLAVEAVTAAPAAAPVAAAAPAAAPATTAPAKP